MAYATALLSGPVCMLIVHQCGNLHNNDKYRLRNAPLSLEYRIPHYYCGQTAMLSNSPGQGTNETKDVECSQSCNDPTLIERAISSQSPATASLTL